MKKVFSLMLCLLLFAACGDDKSVDDPTPDPDPSQPTDPDDGGEDQKPTLVTAEMNPSLWVAVDALGRTIDPVQYKSKTERGDKTVGIFYFIWMGSHGYDQAANWGELRPPSSTDVNSPYDIQKLLDEDMVNPAFGPEHAFHHWGEPYLGYYVANDEWVIRKHAQMLTDAGVDVLFFDVTNSFTYLDVVETICEVYTEMREEGNDTPQFAFVTNSNAGETALTLYRYIYLKGVYKDLWFKWDGKPLLLCNPDEVSSTIKNFFTLRHSWYLYNNSSIDTWFEDGEDKWPWGGMYPQQAGMHNGERECVSVMAATHPTSNIGRSYNVETNVQPGTSAQRSGEGIYFKSQFERALSLDPKVLFFTGWNEWVAQRFISHNGGDYMLGRPLSPGGSYFVDQYNHEFSRDMEPLRGDFGDNYYYQLADYIRQFKGVDPQPVYKRIDSIKIDGTMDEWPYVQAAFADDQGDVTARSHFGYGRVGTLTNTTGRNDILETRVTNDGTHVYFYVKTANTISSYKNEKWMRLFITVKGKESTQQWEGFHFVVNNTVNSEKTTQLESCTGDWNWSKKADIPYALKGNEMELAIPMADLGITNPNEFTLDFKWIDNAVNDGDIQECLSDGDSAPNGRFRYRYQFKKN